MLFKSIKGMFQIIRNYRDAFDLEMFESKYIEECMDKYAYIVGDISSNILRLKGFDNDQKSPAYCKGIEGYLETSCSFGCPHYILKRIRSEAEYQQLEKEEAKAKPIEEKPLITPIPKENFDKESLILITTPKQKPNIVIDINKINAMPKGELAPDLVDVLRADKTSSNKSYTVKSEPEVKKEETTYVSASPDFDPSKSNSFRFNRNNGNNNNKKNQNNKPQNNNNNNNKNNNQNNKGQNNRPNNNNNSNKPNENKNQVNNKPENKPQNNRTNNNNNNNRNNNTNNKNQNKNQNNNNNNQNGNKKVTNDGK